MNLPNAVTVGRIALTPLVAWLPFVPSPSARLGAFLLFLVAAISDGIDGKLARSRKQETDLGRLLDPLADKLLLLATFIPMFVLTGMPTGWSPVVAPVGPGDGVMYCGAAGHPCFPFLTPWGRVALPLWILLVVLGREVFMTVFRQLAARRGVIIAAIGPAKWKTTFQSIWQGASFFWFFAATLAERRAWHGGLWALFAHFNGIVASIAMVGAVLLTLYSLWLYLQRYGRVFAGRTA